MPLCKWSSLEIRINGYLYLNLIKYLENTNTTDDNGKLEEAQAEPQEITQK